MRILAIAKQKGGGREVPGEGPRAGGSTARRIATGRRGGNA